MTMLADEQGTASPPWSHFHVCISVIAWTSFLAACIETLVFFAFFDPTVLGIDAAAPTWMALRSAAYAAGFFFFWMFTFVGSTLTAYMLDSSPETRKRPSETRQ
jgi:hypothetical protein